MKKNNYRMVWSISLLAIACFTIVSVGCSFAGVQLPDLLTRVFGVVDLCALAALAFTSVKLRIWKKEEEQK